MRPDLTLQTAIQFARQSEVVKNQMCEQRSAATADVAEVRHRNYSHRGPAKQNKSSNKYNEECNKCGRLHKQGFCPAKNRKCNGCGKFGHYATKCRASKIKEVVTDKASSFLGSVNDESRNETPWEVHFSIMGTKAKFKIDSGADVTVMMDSSFVALKNQPNLEPSGIQLQSVGCNLICRGHFTVHVQWKKKSFPLKIFVVKGPSKTNLLSRLDAKRMGLIKLNIDQVSIDNSCFGDIGLMNCDPVKIQLKRDAVPYSVGVCRKIPIPLLEKVKWELAKMEVSGVIAKITEPTKWCSPIVPVLKKNDQIRICVDLKHLNKAVVRERYSLPTLDDLLPKLNGAKMFSSLDAASGFYAIPLDERSAKLTTFITPFGRYYFQRLPFGITSAPEIFQRLMNELFQDQDGVIVYMDDILVFGGSQKEHDDRLKNVIEAISKSGLRLNKEKCVFSASSLEFLGHHISESGVAPSIKRIEAINGMSVPTNVTQLKRFLGMVNYLGRFSAKLATILKPLNDLLKSDVAWIWDHRQETAFRNAKDIITESPALIYYNPVRETTVTADASSYGLGAAIFQKVNGELKPVAFASKTLSETEQRYSQIEKECLAAVWACEKFSQYLIGLASFDLYTDHKPLVPLMMTKDLNLVPVRCQRLLMRMMRYSAHVSYVPGKSLVVSDTLSRDSQCSDSVNTELIEDINAYVRSVEERSFSTEKLNAIREATRKEQDLKLVTSYIIHGWPRYAKDVPKHLFKFFDIRHHLSVSDDVILFDDRIYVPPSFQRDILGKIHHGHLGITKCRERAKMSVYWININEDIKKYIQECGHCQTHQCKQRKEPLKPSELPERPWQKIGIDLCEAGSKNFLVATDYYSRYIEIAYLVRTTSANVIGKLKSMFARWGIPDIVVSDNGPQFSSHEFWTFSKDYDFIHATSSPYHPQANGAAERAVGVAKKILCQNDPFLALMAYRATPVAATGFSPARLMIGRELRTTIPVLPRKLEPAQPVHSSVSRSDVLAKVRYKHYFDRHHGVRLLPPLQGQQKVAIRTDQQSEWTNTGVITGEQHDRSYIVQTEGGRTVRRNRQHVRPLMPSQGSTQRQSRSGRIIKQRERLNL